MGVHVVHTQVLVGYFFAVARFFPTSGEFLFKTRVKQFMID